MDIFGYCIVPINYAIRKNLFDKKASPIRELILINIIPNETVKDSNNVRRDPAESGKLFWTICYLFLNNGCESITLLNYLKTITGDSTETIRSMLMEWEKERYINTVKVPLTGGDDMTKVELGLRSFVEIGYQNITKFVTSVLNYDYSDDVARKWAMDCIGREFEKEETEPKEKVSKANK